MEEILPNIFRIEIPLPDSSLQSLNAYAILGRDRSLIVDTGMNLKACEDAMKDALGVLGIDLERTDFFITHLHMDHFGLLPRLAGETNRVYFGRKETESIEAWPGWKRIVRQAEIHGFPAGALAPALRQGKGFAFETKTRFNLVPMDSGQVLTVGDYRFQCVFTPGHSAGHTCLWEASKQMLISGDHVLVDISPNIHCWFAGQNPLKQYLESLEIVAALPVEIVLPGHRRVFYNSGSRIEELAFHHKKRCNEILEILNKRSMTPFEVAAQTSWAWGGGDWDRLPVLQQWFATGETIAHLQFLEEEQLVKRRKDGSTVYFCGR